jgi:hypothetical protein
VPSACGVRWAFDTNAPPTGRLRLRSKRTVFTRRSKGSASWPTVIALAVSGRNGQVCEGARGKRPTKATGGWHNRLYKSRIHHRRASCAANCLKRASAASHHLPGCRAFAAPKELLPLCLASVIKAFHNAQPLRRDQVPKPACQVPASGDLA